MRHISDVVLDLRQEDNDTMIWLDEDQQEWVVSLARCRLLTWDMRRPNRTTRHHYGNRSPLELERDGIGAELAHEILREGQTFADLSVYDPAHHLMRPYDCVYKEWKLDVKATTVQKLLINEEQLLKQTDVDGYAFFRVDWPSFEWLGYIGRDRVHLLGAQDGKYTVPREKLVDDILSVNLHRRQA